MTAPPLSGRVAVVTGAAGRLGPIWVRTLLEAGATTVALVLPDTAEDEHLQRAAATAPERFELLAADVTRRGDLETAAAEVHQRWGVPGILVNNAGVDSPPAPGEGKALEDVDAAELTGIFDVNVRGAFQAMQVFGSAMAKAGRGSIVNVGSLYASVSPDARLYAHIPMDPPFLKPPAYGASKAALDNLTKYFATHWARAGVRVNTLSPGGVRGDQDPEFVAKFADRVPMGRMADPAELGGPLLFLASDASSYVTGINLKVDGGFTAW